MRSPQSGSTRTMVESGGILAAGHSEKGPIRTENQDRFAAFAAANGDVVIVIADGMGGHAGGAEAADAAVSASALILAGPGDPRPRLGGAVAAADAAVAQLRDRIGDHPGTTLVVAWVSRSGALVANLGDSRAYCVRGGLAIPVTADHSWVGEQIRAGLLPESAARHDPKRNIVTRAVLGEAMAPDITEVDLLPGDLLVLCTDGVWEALSDETIAATVMAEAPIVQRTDWLVQAAIDAGSLDDATVVAAEVSR
ncbi:MAG: PP2C family protein-serine/threonine phosphatase [Candidatus Dormibacteria bacterium]